MPAGAISVMTLEDLDAVLTIERSSFSRPWSRAALEGELTAPGGIAFVLAPAPRSAALPVIAYVFLRVLVDEVHVMRIAVDPRWRSMGAATRLMGHALSTAVDASVAGVFLEVREGNRGALSFYRKMGFREVGRRKSYYAEDGEDAIVMKRDIEEAS